jgi:hypothetical protein
MGAESMLDKTCKNCAMYEAVGQSMGVCNFYILGPKQIQGVWMQERLQCAPSMTCQNWHNDEHPLYGSAWVSFSHEAK